MKNIILVFKKELYRVFSDKKLIFSIFILPALLTFGIYWLIGNLTSGMLKDIEDHTPITVVVNEAEGFRDAAASAGFDQKASITYLSTEDFETRKEELTESLKEGETDLILVFEPGFYQKFQAYRNQGDGIPGIQIMYNSTEDYSKQAKSLMQSVLEVYRSGLLEKRLGNLDQLTVFEQIESEIVKSSKAGTEFISTMFPYMIMIMLFSGAMSITVDVFAGEKERGTMAAMLIAPVKRHEIAAGKVTALALMTAISSLIYAVSMILAMSFIGDSSPLAGADAKISFSPVQILELGLMLVVLDFLFVTMLAVLSSIAKDNKSASAFVTPIYMLVLVCAMMTMFSGGGKVSLSRYAIPLYGNALALQDIITAELSLAGFFLSFGVTALLGIFLIFLLARIFDDDKLMFNA